MVTLDDIQRLVMNYGNDILDDERRAHAIICDWHPRETVRFDEVSHLCGQWKKGKRPRVIYIDDDDPSPLLDGSFPFTMAQSFYGADSSFGQVMQTVGKPGKVKKKAVTGNAKKQSATTKADTKSSAKKVDTQSSSKKKTKQKNSIVISTNGNSIAIDGDNISVQQTFKSGVNTRTISIHIDTTQSLHTKKDIFGG